VHVIIIMSKNTAKGVSISEVSREFDSMQPTADAPGWNLDPPDVVGQESSWDVKVKPP
jgi:hypothetical protein